MATLDSGDLGTYNIARLAQSVGASEQALRLLASLLIGYPLLYFYQLYLKQCRPNVQHLYFIISGLSLAVYNYGFYFYHSVVCILAAWLILMTVGGTLMSVMISSVFQMGYLLIGYYVTSTETYDFTWTMPHCVLTLRLIALTFDVYDGTKKEEELSKDQVKTALKHYPTLIEIASQTYFPASFLIGPQFSMRRYLDFIKGTLYPDDAPSPVVLGLLRGLTGILYLCIYQIGCVFLPTDYLLTQEYLNLSFITRLVVVGLWGKLLLYKYISCWLITEGICIFCGLAYSGKDERQVTRWKGCANVKIILLEIGTTFGKLITAFNMNTNAWVAQYVYKRLRFLNNRYLSQIGTLLFLALWHGFHSGYYACFLLEFMIMSFEKDVNSMMAKFPAVAAFLDKPPVSNLMFILLKIYTILFMGYSVGSFVLLKIKWWWDFYASVYFIGHIFFGGWILYGPIVKILLKKANTYLEKSGSEGDSVMKKQH